MIKVEQTFNALPGHKAVGHETFGHIGHFRGHAQNGGGVSGLEQGMADRIVHGHDLVRVLKGDTAFFLAEAQILFHPLAQGNVKEYAGQVAGFRRIMVTADQNPGQFSGPVDKTVFQFKGRAAARDAFPHRAPDHLQVLRIAVLFHAGQAQFNGLGGRAAHDGIKIGVGVDKGHFFVSGHPADAAGQGIHQALQLPAAPLDLLPQRHFPGHVQADADGDGLSVPGDGFPAHLAQPDRAAVFFQNPVFRAELPPLARGLVHALLHQFPIFGMDDFGITAAGFFKKFRVAIAHIGQKGPVDVDQRILRLRAADHQGAAEPVAADPERGAGLGPAGGKINVQFSSHDPSVAGPRPRQASGSAFPAIPRGPAVC